MPDHVLSEVFETAGEWFLPDEPNRVVAGTLHYTTEYSELHLHEAFKPVRGAVRVGDRQLYPLVHGSTTTGDLVTLFNGQRSHLGINIGAAGLRQPEHILSTLVAFGAHLPADFAFPEMRFRVPGLETWLSRHAIEVEYRRDSDSKWMTIEYRVSGVPEETMRLDAIAATLGFGIDTKHHSRLTDLSVKASGWLRLRPDVPKSMDWFLTQLQTITTLMVVLAGDGMSSDRIDASIDDSRHQVSLVVPLNDVKYCPYSSLHEFFMHRGAMGADLEQVVRRWFEVYSSVDVPSRLAGSILTATKLWLHVEFISLMQALEGFHRALQGGNYMDDAGYEAVKETLTNAIPPAVAPDHRQALKSKIRYGNQFSLGKRLGALTQQIPLSISGRILAPDGKVPHRWIDTRNYHTHWDETLRGGLLDGHAMVHASARMRMFLRVLYLGLAGIPESAILAALDNHSDASQGLMNSIIMERRRANPSDGSGVLMTVEEQIASNASQDKSKPSPPSDDS